MLISLEHYPASHDRQQGSTIILLSREPLHSILASIGLIVFLAASRCLFPAVPE